MMMMMMWFQWMACVHFLVCIFLMYSHLVSTFNVYWFSNSAVFCFCDWQIVFGKHKSIGLPVICKNRYQHCSRTSSLNNKTIELYCEKLILLSTGTVDSWLYNTETNLFVRHILTRFHCAIKAGQCLELTQTFWKVRQNDGDGKKYTQEINQPYV